MAIGLAMLLGIRLPNTFTPVLRHLDHRLWRRWHITLSFWRATYLYIPLGGQPAPAPSSADPNILVTMAFGRPCGHGASWTFRDWGVLHGVRIPSSI